MSGQKDFYMIGGPMGVGKTAVCQRLKADLPNSVFLDGDWCWDASPFQVTEETKAMVLANIRAVLGNFLRCSAYENILFCWVLDRQDTIDAILQGLPPCRVHPVSLLAEPDTLRARLAADIAQGRRNPDIVARSLARLPLYPPLRTAKIHTDGKTIPQVAAEVERVGEGL